MKCSVAFKHCSKKHESVSVLSISAGGMFIALNGIADNNFKKGDPIESIQFDLTDLGIHKLRGTIVHSMSVGEIGGCGVEFDDMPQEAVSLLDLYVERKLKDFGLWDIC